MGIGRMIFGGLDRGIYDLLTSVYQLLMQIASLEIFDNETISEFSTRIYAILGILMGFKLIFTFINYVVNPDSITNDKVGGKKLVINIITALVLLIAVPTVIFPLSRKVQAEILNNHVLEQLILGMDSDAYSAGTNVVKSSRMTSYFVFTSFFYPSVCDSNAFYLDEEITGDWESQDEQKNYKYKLNGECAEAIVENVKGENGLDVVKAYEKAYNQFSVRWLTGKVDGIELKDVKTKENGEYLFDYTILVSTLVGVVVTWILFSFCFGIAVRSIKLGVLELIAPIPILSYIDSKTKKTFDNWVKACTSAYAELFVKLIGVYFAVFVISNIGLGKIKFSEESGITTSVGVVINLFVIIGALMFAQQLPKLVDEIFGTKLGSAKFSLNPLKSSPLANAAVGGVVGGVLGTAGGVAANAWARNAQMKKLKEDVSSGKRSLDSLSEQEKFLYGGGKKAKLFMLGSSLGGGVSGGFRSMFASGKSGLSGGGLGKMVGGVGTGIHNMSDSRRRSAQGFGLKQRMVDKATDIAGIETKYGTTSENKAKIKQLSQKLENLKQQEMVASQGIQNTYSSHDGKYYKSYLEAFKQKQNEAGKMEYENKTYAEYLEKALTEAEKIDYSKLKKEDAKNKFLSSRGIITEKQFDNMKAIHETRDQYDELGKQVEKEIEQIKEASNIGKKKN